MAHARHALVALYDISRSTNRKLPFARKSANETLVRLKDGAPVAGQVVEIALLSVAGRLAVSSDQAPFLR
jgi:hypothetical protein